MKSYSMLIAAGKIGCNYFIIFSEEKGTSAAVIKSKTIYH